MKHVPRENPLLHPSSFVASCAGADMVKTNPGGGGSQADVLLARNAKSRKAQDDVFDGVHAVTDDHEGFFKRGRDFEAIGDAHTYTEQEKKTLESFESIQYLPPNNAIFREYLSNYTHWGYCDFDMVRNTATAASRHATPPLTRRPHSRRCSGSCRGSSSVMSC